MNQVLRRIKETPSQKVRFRFEVTEKRVAPPKQKLWFRFDERKATAAATVLLNEADGQMRHLRLMKLMYIAERRSMERWNEPIFGGKYCSMKYGPLPGTVYDLWKEGGGVWSEHVIKKSSVTVALEGKPFRGPLSKEEIELLEAVSAEFADVDTFELCKRLHALPEYTETQSSVPISADDIMRAVGKSETEIQEAAGEAAHDATMAQIFV